MSSGSFDHDAFDKSSLGMDSRLAAALSYIPIVGLIFFFLEKKSAFVRFHAAQSVLIDIVLIALNLVSAILGLLIRIIPVFGALVMFLINAVIGIGGLALLVLGAYHAWSGKRIEYPVVGQLATRFAANIKPF